MTLEPIPIEDLMLLAKSEFPPSLAGLASVDALPPAFVAARSLAQWHAGKPLAWCSTFYIRDEDRRVIGGCGFKDVPVDGQVEIGYAVAPADRNRGHATAAIGALVAIAAASGEVSAVLAEVARDNLASARVVQKLGFQPGGERLDADGEWLVQWRLRLADRHR